MISAKKAKLIYDSNNAIQYLTFENEVKFTYQKNKNIIGFGLADKIDYTPEIKTIKLLSINDKKVLFWQKIILFV